jgi:hypothetical protein
MMRASIKQDSIPIPTLVKYLSWFLSESSKSPLEFKDYFKETLHFASSGTNYFPSVLFIYFSLGLDKFQFDNAFLEL